MLRLYENFSLPPGCIAGIRHAAGFFDPSGFPVLMSVKPNSITLHVFTAQWVASETDTVVQPHV